MSNGKGDRQRPCDKEKFDEHYTRIFRRRKKQYARRIPAAEVFKEDECSGHDESKECSND